MKKIAFLRRAALALVLVLVLELGLPGGSALADTGSEPVIRVGLSYGTNVLATANLENEAGSGYEFGLYDETGGFTVLGSTEETKLTMMKDKNIYLSSGRYYDTKTAAAYTLIGAYHLQPEAKFDTWDEALAAAKALGGFVACSMDAYYVRYGSYGTAAEVSQAAEDAGTVTLPDGRRVCVTGVTSSQYGITVCATGTADILFELDQGAGTILGVRPVSQTGEKTTTWFKGFLYYGGFTYQRQTGDDLTVVNLVPQEDYVACVVTREMSVSWPLEALKAGACAARTYARRASGHDAQGFDVCGSTCCQVYSGLYTAGDMTRAVQAAEETAGECIYYDGSLIEALYYSSNGGASEDAKYAWGSSFAYLTAKYDPFESRTNTSNTYWAYSYTKSQLTSLLQSEGYGCSTVTSLRVTEYTPIGNVQKLVFTDSSGQTFVFSGDNVRLFENSADGKYFSRKFTVIAPHSTGTFLKVTMAEDSLGTASLSDSGRGLRLSSALFDRDSENETVSASAAPGTVSSEATFSDQAEDTVSPSDAAEAETTGEQTEALEPSPAAAQTAASEDMTDLSGGYYIYDGTNLTRARTVTVLTAAGTSTRTWGEDVLFGGAETETETAAEPEQEPEQTQEVPQAEPEPEQTTVTAPTGTTVTAPTGYPEAVTQSITVKNDSDSYLIVGSGWGHNIGMSQYGAKAMAELGYTYDQILKFYYTGVTIE